MPTEPKPAKRIDRWRKARRAAAREQGRGDLPGQLLFPWYGNRAPAEAADVAGQLRFPWAGAPIPAEESRTTGLPTAGRVSSLRRKGAST